MSTTPTANPDATPQHDEFQAIEATFTQTARGRWFLAEFARRNRTADTEIVLAAVERLGTKIPGREVAEQVDGLKAVLAEIMDAIELSAQEAAAQTHPAIDADALAGQDPLEAVASLSTKATSSILDAAEQIQELAWTLRERGSDGAACDLLDQHATDIYAACSLQEVAMRRLGLLLKGVRHSHDGIAALCAAWGVTDAPAPAEPAITEPPASPEDDLDFVFAEPHAEAGPEESQLAEAQPDPEKADAERRRRERLAVLAEIDGLDLRDKLKLFS
jgi:hypothetical protein